MIVADIDTPIKLRAAGLRLLNEGLGSRKAQEFLDDYYDGDGDSLAEKKAQLPWTDADHEEALAFVEAEDGSGSDMWRGASLLSH